MGFHVGGRNCARVVCKSTITLNHCAFFQTRVHDTNFKGMEFFPWHTKQLVQVTGLHLAFLIVHFSHQGLHHCLLPKSLRSVWFRQSSFQHYNFGPEFSFLCAGNSPVLTGFFSSNIKCLPHKKEVELTHASPWFMSSIFHAVFFLQIQNLFYPWFMGSFRVRPHNITQNGYELAVKLNSPASASWVDDVGESRHQLVNE